MEKFKISDIQELFTADVERFLSLTQTHVAQLLTETPPPQESLDEALRQTHTLKGLAATVHAWGLSCLGSDFEKLLEVAGSWMNADRDKANEIFHFIQDHQQDWFVMNQFTCMEMLPQSWDIYLGLRAMMEVRWRDYLPAIEAGEESNAKSVRLADLDFSEILSGDAPAIPWEFDIKGMQPEATPAAPAPTPLSVVPPNLRQRKGKKSKTTPAVVPPAEIVTAAPATPVSSGPETNRDVQQTDSIAHAPDAAKPTPVSVVPPTLRRAEAKATETTQSVEVNLNPTVLPTVGPVEQSVVADALLNPETSVAPAQNAEDAGAITPPILRVAPPALKRRANKTEVPPPVAEVASVESAAAEQPFDEAALFAVIEPAPEAVIVPEPVVAEVSTPEVALIEAAKSSEEFQPSADADLLEMLGQEVGGYLTDLAENLASLAINLADESEWEKTRRLFHTIKGTAATFHLEAVSAPAKAAEARCLVAIEDSGTRTREAFETCVQRAQVVAKALRLPFDAEPLLAALENTFAAKLEVAALPDTAAAAIDPEMAGFFVRDARDQIAIIEQAVLRWEKGENPTEQVQAAQRGFHTLKGAGNSIGFTAVAQSVHEVEAFLEGVASGSASGSRALFTFLLGAVDQLRSYLNEITKNSAAPWRNDWSTALNLLGQPEASVAASKPEEAAPTPTVVPSEVADDDSHSLRVETGRLYELMNLIGEMVIDRARLEKKIEQLTALHRALADRNSALTGSVQSFQQQFEFNLLQGQNQRGQGPILNGRGVNPLLPGANGAHEFSELEFDRYDQFNILARSLVEISHDIEQLHEEVAVCLDSFSAENVQFTQTSQSLQSKVTNLSLVPVNTLFPRLKRAFRDALNVECKDADLKLQGGEALLDKVVVDKIYAPLLHLLRNSVAHGIEDAVAREKLKKPARGQVKFSATQVSNQIVIQITDDGAGVNAAAVRKRAIEKGWLAADAPELTADQVVHYIFQPGFSTAAKVTSVSGRGIGLDVVRKDIEALNGSVELKYERDQGSMWTLRLPLTLSISEAILANVGDSQFAFPLNFVEAGLILDEPTTRDENGRELFRVGEVSLPVLRLGRICHLPADENSTKGIIVSIGDRRSIVVVDRVLARQEIVIKQLDSIMAQHPLLNGATLDAEGRVIPILNLPALLKVGERSGAGEARATVRPMPGAMEEFRVLIVDDSLSVRKVQERMLTELGCQVTTAADGLYALEKLREGEFDFIFTDLEMPRLNGYELISDLRGNPAWAGIPIVVISSRGADKYITKAMNLGASTFLSKPFTQQQLQQVLNHYAKASLQLTA